MKDNKLLAIVMGRNYTSRLGMIRAAGRMGCKIVTIQTTYGKNEINKIDASSKYVVKAITSIEPHQDDLIAKILQFKDPNNKVILLPTDDYTASTIDQHLDLLKNDFLMPHVHHTQGGIVRLMSKELQKQLARESGLLVAQGWRTTFENGQYQIPSGIIYPCFVKPNESFKNPMKKYMKKCLDEVELKKQLAIISKVSHNEILIEQYIDIDKEYAVLGVSLDTESVMPALVSMKSSYLGVTAVGEVSSINSIKGLEDMLKRFVNSTGLTGLFDIDLYESKGRVYFNELNLRLGASGYAVTNASVNLIELFIRHLFDKNFRLNVRPTDFKPLLFANEKTCLAKYTHGQWNYKEYKKALEHVDFSFIKDEEDKKPYANFKRVERNCRIKKLLSVIIPV